MSKLVVVFSLEIGVYCVHIDNAWNVSKYGVFSGPYFTVLGLNKNTEIYGVSLQYKYRNIRTRKNSVFGHFSRSVK